MDGKEPLTKFAIVAFVLLAISAIRVRTVRADDGTPPTATPVVTDPGGRARRGPSPLCQPQRL